MSRIVFPLIIFSLLCGQSSTFKVLTVADHMTSPDSKNQENGHEDHFKHTHKIFSYFSFFEISHSHKKSHSKTEEKSKICLHFLNYIFISYEKIKLKNNFFWKTNLFPRLGPTELSFSNKEILRPPIA